MLGLALGARREAMERRRLTTEVRVVAALATLYAVAVALLAASRVREFADETDNLLQRLGAGASLAAYWGQRRQRYSLVPGT